MNIEQLNFIENRMRELGIEKYHIRAMILDFSDGQSSQYIKAYNEFIFLVEKTAVSDVIIHSDNNIIHSPFGETFEQLPQEFQGYISIESSSQDIHSLEFIRIIPQ